MTHPDHPEFDQEAYERAMYAQRGPTLKDRAQKALAPVVAAAAAVAKLGALVFKIKFLGLAISMLVSVLGYTLFFGWTFAVGLVLLVLVHELGHVVVMRGRGYSTGLPVFIPLLGAYVKGQKTDATRYDACWASLAGPLFGGAAALAVLGAGQVYDSSFLDALGYFGLYVNLLNLSPISPLDGATPGAALKRFEWVVLIAVLLAVELQDPSPALPILMLTGAYRLYKTWNAQDDFLPIDQRLTVVATYLGIIAITLLAMHGHQPVARHL